MFNAKPNLVGDYLHIYSKDPAVDQKSSDYYHEQWCKTGKDSFLPLVNGATPVKFKLKHLTSREKKYAQDVGTREGQSSMSWWLVALALKGIDPYVVQGSESTEIDYLPDGWRLRVSDEVMDLLESYDGCGLFYELAVRVMQQSWPDPI